MKALHLLPPVLALAASAVWLGSQHVQLNDLKEKTQVLTERISFYESAPASQQRSSVGGEKVDPLAKFFLENGDFDWVAIGKAINESHNSGMPSDIGTFVELQQKLLAMSVDEIEEALAQIEQQPLSNKIKENLELMLIGVYVGKDPAGALAHFKDRLDEPHGPLTWQLTRAFESWMKQDSVAALAWFDRRKRLGSFDTKSLDPSTSLGRQFEVRLLGKLLEDDVSAVQSRLAALPDDEKKSLLKSATLMGQGKGLSANYLALLREHLPEEELYVALADAFGQQVFRGNLPELNEQAEKAGLAPAEKEAVIKKITENFARPWDRKPADLIEIYAWADREAPGQAAELTGQTFAHYAGHRNTDFTETFREVLKAVETQEEPAILNHFISSLKESQRHLEGIEDSDLQTTYRELIETLPTSSDQ